ncbi:hypothetical protein Pint_33119 [Pistacia integerrima]|uniref:Uncharacterized protein n=1 Tax=Pistacia integerrima TaxID=434235 RepID=A0ACC0X4Z3_9ROSI|nr:hypothetical protein Pint_33119 [Pistacia integerrima]
MAAPANVSAKCPVDLNYVLRIPWNTTDCRNYDLLHTTSNITITNYKNPCCQSLLSLFGVALAEHLKETSLFNLPDVNTSIACMQDYQSKLSSLSLPDNLVSLCFDPLQFVITPNVCASIVTIKDWEGHLGKSTQLDLSCKRDLTDLSFCDACVNAGYRVQSQLIAIDGNRTHAIDCFYFTVLYAAGMVNEFGPESDGALSCIFGLSLNSQVGFTNSRHSALVFGLTGAGVAIFVMTGMLGLYFWWDKKLRRRFYSTRLDSGYSLEEQGSRLKFRPNTGSIWFKIQDLERATDNFSQRNIIGKGGFGVVYKGVLKDGTMVAVKEIIESDFQGDAEFCNEVEIISNLKHRNLVPLRGCCVIEEDSPSYDERVKAGKVEEVLDVSLLREGDFVNSNPKAIMERFLLVGILCAHVMVVLRPTIADALKMLEGDIEVPPLPDRPMPLGHPSFYGDGNAFSISPALSGPQLRPGDMLRNGLFEGLVQRNCDLVPRSKRPENESACIW